MRATSPMHLRAEHPTPPPPPPPDIPCNQCHSYGAGKRCCRLRRWQHVLTCRASHTCCYKLCKDPGRAELHSFSMGTFCNGPAFLPPKLARRLFPMPRRANQPYR